MNLPLSLTPLTNATGNGGSHIPSSLGPHQGRKNSKDKLGQQWLCSSTQCVGVVRAQGENSVCTVHCHQKSTHFLSSNTRFECARLYLCLMLAVFHSIFEHYGNRMRK